MVFIRFDTEILVFVKTAITSLLTSSTHVTTLLSVPVMTDRQTDKQTDSVCVNLIRSSDSSLQAAYVYGQPTNGTVRVICDVRATEYQHFNISFYVYLIRWYYTL